MNTLPRYLWTALAAFLLPLAGAAAAEGTVLRAHFQSKALGVEKSYFIYLPASYATSSKTRYPVVVLLHGYGNTEAEWISSGAIDRTADALMPNQVPDMILVMPDGDNSGYLNWANKPDFAACQNWDRQGATEFCVRYGRYADYITQDLLAEIDSKYRTLPDRAHRAIAGLSTGGYGATHLGLANGDKFGAMASLSGALLILLEGPHPYKAPAKFYETIEAAKKGYGEAWPVLEQALGTSMANWRKHDPAFMIDEAVRKHAPLPALYFMVGAGDKETLDDNRAFHDKLLSLKVAHEYHEWPGVHEWSFWQRHERDVLTWLGAQIGATKR